MNERNQTGSHLYLIPLVVGLLFSGLMVFVGVISTEKARNHYKANRLLESVQKLRPIRINVPGMNHNDPPPPPPVKKRSWFVKYETSILFTAVPLAILGIYFGLMAVRRDQLPQRNPLGLDDRMRQSIMAMVCSFVLSPACLMLYIWTLRVGLIG